MADKVINPETGKPVTKQFARDMGFLDEAEPYDPDGGSGAMDDMEEEMDDFMSGGGFEDELEFDDEPGDAPEGDQIEEQARRLDDIGEGPSETVRDENDFFGENFEQEKPWVESGARPLYTNKTRRTEEEGEAGEPEIDKREEDWEDDGRTYENTDIGGIRVRD